ncbi:MAG TPA: glycosyltransferase family 9 protein [Bacteroidota bacterium]
MNPRFERVLLTRLRFIGDIVLTTPIIKSIRDALPHSTLAFLGELPGVRLLEGNPHLNEIVPVEPDASPLSQLLVYPRLRMSRFDLVIDLFSNPRSALLSYATGAKVRVGAGGRARSRLYTHPVFDDGKPRSVLDFHAQYLGAAGIPLTSRKTEIFLSDDERREAVIYLRWQGIVVDRPVVGLHPGASWPAKMWQMERFAELADLISSKAGAQVVFTQGPGEGQLVRDIAARCAAPVKVLETLPVRQLAAVLSNFHVYVANDSGPMHIAAAVGTRTIGIFGPGEENIWFPYGHEDGHLALRKDVWCHPCHLNVCDKEEEGFMKCMRLLEPLEVFEAVKERIESPVLSR